MVKKSGTGYLICFIFVFVLGAAAMGGTAGALHATDQAAFCGECHVMSEAAWTHSQSVHAELACNECHTPYTLASKLPFKALAGARDVYHNTFGDVPSLIQARQDTKDVVQANCRRCHAATTMTVAMDSKEYCTGCHRSVPHMNKLPIVQRKAADV